MTLHAALGAPTVRRRNNHTVGGATFVGPLDALPAPTAAYSMRRLLSAYIANKAVNVRRNSDNAAIDVGFLANGDLDVPTLTTFLAATTGAITTWYDQSGSNFDLAQGTAANQPVMVIAEATMNNRPTGSYLIANVNNLTKVTPPTLAQPFTIAVVAERTGAFTTSQHIFDAQTSFGTLLFPATINTFGANFGSTVTVTASDSVAHCLAAVANGPTSKLAVDGAITSGLSPGSNSFSGITVSKPATPLTGFLGEAIAFSSLVSDANIGILQANQKTYWGTP